MTFRVGMKVVCVDDLPRLVEKYPHRAKVGTALIKGQVYTVAFMSPDMHGRPGVHLVEVQPRLPPYRDGRPRGFFPERFRPAVQPGISFDTSIPADPDSEQYDNRRRIPVPEWGCSA